MTDVEAAIISGRWITRTWWKDPSLRNELRITSKQVEDAFAALEEVFDEAWCTAQVDEIILHAKEPVPLSPGLSDEQRQWLEAWDKLLGEKLAEAKNRYQKYIAARSLCATHCIVEALFHRGGLDTFMFLYMIGSSLVMLKDKGLLNDLPARLRSDGQFEGARAELTIIASWVDAGARVERDVCSGKGKDGRKNCDLRVSNDSAEIFIEIKQPAESKANRERRLLTDIVVSEVLSRLHAKGLDGQFDMELLLRPKNREDVEQHLQDAKRTADAIAAHVQQFREDGSGTWKTVQGLARYRYMPADEKLRGEAGGVHQDSPAEADKVMRSVRDAVGQIPAGGPGLVMISGHGNPALTILAPEFPGRIVERFQERVADYADIAGVLILRSLYVSGHGEAELGTFVPNPAGPRLSLKLLKQGVPNLQEWDWEKKEVRS